MAGREGSDAATAPLRICLVASECTPFAKTGGLADVTAALARFLDADGQVVRLYLPLYRRIRDSGVELRPHPSLRDVSLEFGTRRLRFSIVETDLPGSKLAVRLVDCPELYDRPAIYCEDGDEDLRFAFLSRAVIDASQYEGFAPHVFHCNDWHTGLLPLYLRSVYGWDALFARSKTLLALHNLGYQGVFPAERIPILQLGNEHALLDQEELRHGSFGFLKTGLHWANRLCTVSETYAREIQTPEQGMGLEGILRRRAADLSGIVNGIDVREWDPSADPHLPFPFDASDLSGKRRNRDALLEELGLQAQPAGPVLGVVSRLTPQKGFELLPEVLVPVLEHHDARLIVLGSGETRYEGWFHWLGQRFAGKVCFWRGYNEPLAHRIEAASDVFLMPSQYEPCGLNQMYSQRYGTVPVVRRTGGLADTVQPWNTHDRSGTGFLFDEFRADALAGALRRCFEVFGRKDDWQVLVRNGMARDFSWERQGRRYVELYRAMAGV